MLAITISQAVTLKMSLEECIAMAEKNSLQALFTQIEQEKLDLNDAENWQLVLPRVGYRLGNYREETQYIFHGEGDPLDSFYYYYKDPWGDSFSIEDDSVTKATYFKHEVFISQRLFDSKWLEVFEDIKSNAIRKEILTLRFKANIRYDVRMAYYRCLIYEEWIKRGRGFQEMFINSISDESFLGELMDIEQQSIIIRLEEDLLSLRKAIEYNKRILLTTMAKPLNTELILSTPLTPPEINLQDAETKALENNLQLKKLAIQKMEKEARISKEALTYLPQLDFTLSTPLLDNLSGNLTAKFNDETFNYYDSTYGYPGNFYVDVGATYVLDDKCLEYETLAGDTLDTLNGSPSLWTKEDKLNYSLKLSLSLTDILRADTNTKKQKADLKSIDVSMKEEIANILFNMEDRNSEIDNLGRKVKMEKQELDLLMKKKALLEKTIPLDNNQLFLDYYIQCLSAARSLATSTQSIVDQYHAFVGLLGYVDGI